MSTTDHIADLDERPYAAFELGIGSRVGYSDLLQQGLLPFYRSFHVNEVVAVNSLMAQIPPIWRDAQIALDNYCRREDAKSGCTSLESPFTDLDSGVLPPLQDLLGRMMRDLPDLEPWFLLGCCLGECMVSTQRKVRPPDFEEKALTQFGRICQTLSPAQISAVPPCRVWVEKSAQDGDNRGTLSLVLKESASDPSMTLGDVPGGPITNLTHRIGWFLRRVTAHSKIRNSQDERNAWIYEECTRGTPYKKIISLLKEMRKGSPIWGLIGSVNGIKAAADRHVRRHSGLQFPPKRKQAARSTK